MRIFGVLPVVTVLTSTIMSVSALAIDLKVRCTQGGVELSESEFYLDPQDLEITVNPTIKKYGSDQRWLADIKCLSADTENLANREFTCNGNDGNIYQLSTTTGYRYGLPGDKTVINVFDSSGNSTYSVECFAKSGM
jgi:hypothetical protein